MREIAVPLDPAARVPFHNAVDWCVGTGRMGLALQKEYHDQLALVQREIGFSHIRGHGLFCDDMAIYQEYPDGEGGTRAEYNFTYLDLVMDDYRALGLRPFLELGFMPRALASGEQTVFSWRGNVTPPKDHGRWCALVQTTLRHLMDRYGGDEVVQWPVEVWNEPNLAAFWQDASMPAYFELFRRTFAAVKEVDPRFQVGGPAVCGGTDREWMRAFLDDCRAHGVRPDFITRHHYTTDTPRRDGHYGYAALSDPEEGFANLASTRQIVDGYDQFRGLPIHLTEFNTSYIPNCPLHDTVRNAAYIARQLSRLGDYAQSYSYWTFGDIFEEQGVPFTPFHGGFGLVADGCIPKPTLWAFRFFKDLKGGECIFRSDEAVVVKTPEGYRGVAWNLARSGDAEPLRLRFTLPADAPCCLVTRTVDEEHADPLRCWHDLGEPSSLTAEQRELLREAARPGVRTRTLRPEDGRAEVELDLGSNALIGFQVLPVRLTPDRGYDYRRAADGTVPGQ